MSFEKLAESVELTVEYTTRGTLAIGAGKEPAYSASEQPIVKIGGEPVIPGSSLKGALRSATEAILSQAGLKVCVPEAAIPKEKTKGDHGQAYAKQIGRKAPCFPSDPCPVCQIFGAATLSGRAFFLDARPKEGTNINLIERSHVALTRDSRAAAGGKLMQLEAVDAGAVFKGAIRLINPEPWQVGALLASLESLNLLGLGGRKTAGYGELEIHVTKIERKTMIDGMWQMAEAKLDYASEFKQFVASGAQK